MKLSHKDNLTKENARIKRVLKKNEYQESIISKSLRELPTIAACLVNARHASHIYPRGRNQNEYKFNLRPRC